MTDVIVRSAGYPANQELVEQAQRAVMLLRDEFPRRIFHVVTDNGRVMIEVKDAYVKIHVRAKTSVYVVLAADQVRSSMSNLTRTVQGFFLKETELRRRHTHLKATMRGHIEALQKTELLHQSNLVFTMSAFGGEERLCPEVNIAFAEVPDIQFATIQYTKHHNRKLRRLGQNPYIVRFAGVHYHLDSWQKVCDLFDGATIFKDMDSNDSINGIAMIEHSGALANEHGQDPVFVRTDDLAVLAPYLLVMECVGFVEHTAELHTEAKITAESEAVVDPKVHEAVRRLFFKAESTSFLMAYGYTKLAWDGSLA